MKKSTAQDEQSSVELSFETQTYVGSEIAELRADHDERPPRSAKFVVYVSWGWSPAHSLYIKYFLSTDRSRRFWILWVEGPDLDTGKPLYGRKACGWPYRGIPAKYAAERLLCETWKEEIRFGFEIDGVRVELEGLLDEQDIRRIERAVSVDD